MEQGLDVALSVSRLLPYVRGRLSDRAIPVPALDELLVFCHRPGIALSSTFPTYKLGSCTGPAATAPDRTRARCGRLRSASATGTLAAAVAARSLVLEQFQPILRILAEVLPELLR